VYNGELYATYWYGNFPELSSAFWKNGDVILFATGGDNRAGSIFVTKRGGSPQYIVTFAGEGINIAPQLVEEGAHATRPEDPDRDNYDFAGWFIDNETFLHEWVFEIDVVTEDMTLYAKWTPKSGIEGSKSGGINIYPNPAKGVLNVETNEFAKKKVTIYNTSGQVVDMISDINSYSFKVNIEKFSSGLYFIAVQTKTEIINLKFVIK
jgi:uncharacterized repeat protein (TIGR02543 family)